MKELINDSQRLVSAKYRSGTEIPVYDDGYGPLWIHRDSMGISGIVRCREWHDAYEICEDEFFPEASETVDELRKEYNFTSRYAKIVRTKGGNELEQPFLADETFEFVRWQTIKTPSDDENAWTENELFQEAYGFRPNGPRAGKWENGEPRDPIGHGIYAKDLNGDRLDLLTPELLAELEITLEIANEE